MFNVQIYGSYGDDDCEITLYDGQYELVTWTSDEWKENPSLVVVIANAIRAGFMEGAEGIRLRLGEL